MLVISFTLLSAVLWRWTCAGFCSCLNTTAASGAAGRIVPLRPSAVNSWLVFNIKKNTGQLWARPRKIERSCSICGETNGKDVRTSAKTTARAIKKKKTRLKASEARTMTRTRTKASKNTKNNYNRNSNNCNSTARPRNNNKKRNKSNNLQVTIYCTCKRFEDILVKKFWKLPLRPKES